MFQSGIARTVATSGEEMKKKTLYGAWINLGGLGDVKPLKLRYDKESRLYWVDDGPCKDDFSFNGPGLCVKDGCIRFASENYDETLAFILGIRAGRSLSWIPNLEVEGES